MSRKFVLAFLKIFVGSLLSQSLEYFQPGEYPSRKVHSDVWKKITIDGSETVKMLTTSTLISSKDSPPRSKLALLKCLQTVKSGMRSAVLKLLKIICNNSCGIERIWQVFSSFSSASRADLRVPWSKLRIMPIISDKTDMTHVKYLVTWGGSLEDFFAGRDFFEGGAILKTYSSEWG